MEQKDLERRLIKAEWWIKQIINELNTISNAHAYYSSFEIDAVKELKHDNPMLFKELFEEDEYGGLD